MKIKRRDFVKLAAAGGAALGASYPGLVSARSFNPQGTRYASAGRDQYGGCMDIQFEATGFFRLEKTDRWWFVTPEGNAYLTFGVNHAELKNIMRGDIREHWASEFGVPKDAGREAFQAGFEAKLWKDMKAFGFTTLGIHSPTHDFTELRANDVVNVRMVDICHYMTPTADDFRDVFSDGFVRHCDERAREVAAPRKDDPRVLGYSLTDCPILTEPESWPHAYNIYGWEREQVPTWPRVLRNLGEESPGKREYVTTMRQIYSNSIRDFNRTYSTDFSSFEELQQTRDWRRRSELDNRREARDNESFLLKVIDRCYETEVAAIRKHDPNHLILGDKFQGNRMGLEVPEEHIAIFAKHFDVLFFQKYAAWDDLEPLLDKFRKYGGGKPCYAGDSSMNVAKEKMPDPFGPRCANQDIRAEAFREAFYKSYARYDFVGWDWCGWLDLWVEDPDNLKGRDPRHAGVQDPYGNYDQPIQKEMRDFADKMYDIATGKISLP